MADTKQTVFEALQLDKNSNMYQDYIKPMLARKHNKYDNVSAVTGYEGVGKSTFSKIAGANYFSGYSFDKNVIFRTPKPDRITKMFRTYPKGSVFDFDEAIDIANKWEWQKQIQMTINKESTKIRKRRYSIFLNIPSFLGLNTHFRTHRVLWHIEIIDRGYAVVFKAEHDTHEIDPFGINQIKLIKKTWREENGKPKKLKDKIALRMRYPTFYSHFDFPPLPNWVEDLYERKIEEARKAADKQEVDFEYEDAGSRKRKMMLTLGRMALIKKRENPKLRIEDIADEYGYSRTRMGQLISLARKQEKRGSNDDDNTSN